MVRGDLVPRSWTPVNARRGASCQGRGGVPLRNRCQRMRESVPIPDRSANPAGTSTAYIAGPADQCCTSDIGKARCLMFTTRMSAPTKMMSRETGVFRIQNPKRRCLSNRKSIPKPCATVRRSWSPRTWASCVSAISTTIEAIDDPSVLRNSTTPSGRIPESDEGMTGVGRIRQSEDQGARREGMSGTTANGSNRRAGRGVTDSSVCFSVADYIRRRIPPRGWYRSAGPGTGRGAPSGGNRPGTGHAGSSISRRDRWEGRPCLPTRRRRSFPRPGRRDPSATCPLCR